MANIAIHAEADTHVGADKGRISNLTAARRLIAEWAELARETASGIDRKLARRRISVVAKAVRSAAENADDVMLKLALWRGAKSSDDKRMPADALLRSALDDLSSLSEGADQTQL
ncbi:MAG: hypothetical protein R3C60_07420 [Parvularculaceae bacterium]